MEDYHKNIEVIGNLWKNLDKIMSLNPAWEEELHKGIHISKRVQNRFKDEIDLRIIRETVAGKTTRFSIKFLRNF